jgi:hypothetical protein
MVTEFLMPRLKHAEKLSLNPMATTPGDNDAEMS